MSRISVAVLLCSLCSVACWPGQAMFTNYKVDPQPKIDSKKFSEFGGRFNLRVMLSPDNRLVLHENRKKGRPETFVWVDYDPQTGLGAVSKRVEMPSSVDMVVGAAFDSRGYLLLSSDWGRQLILIDPKGDEVEGFATNAARAARGIGDFHELRLIPGRFLMIPVVIEKPVPGYAAIAIDTSTGGTVIALSETGEKVGQREFLKPDSWFLGPWNEPDTVCFVEDKQLFKWKNGAEPEPVDEPYPDSTWMTAMKLPDGGWFVTDWGWGYAFLDAEAEQVFRWAPPGSYYPDHQRYPFTPGEMENLQNYMFISSWACDGEFYFGRGFEPGKPGREFVEALNMCKVPVSDGETENSG